VNKVVTLLLPRVGFDFEPTTCRSKSNAQPVAPLLCRKLQKEKRKEQHRRKMETGIDKAPTRSALKRNTMKNSRCKITVAVDLSFDDLMSEKVSLSPSHVENI